MRLQEGLLDQVRRLQLDPQRGTDERARHQSQVVAVELQEPPQRILISIAGPLQEPSGHGIVPHITPHKSVNPPRNLITGLDAKTRRRESADPESWPCLFLI
jgi:hypothetical protein